MKLYELTCLISPDISEQNLQNLREEITSFIQEKGGILGKTKNPVKTRLGYLIKEKGEATSVTFNFHFDPSNLADLEKNLKQKPQILRYLILAQKLPMKKPVILPPERVPTKKVEISLKKEKVMPTKRREKVDLKEIEEKLKEILGE